MIRFNTARLSIREFRPEDASEILVLLNSDDFIRHIGDRGVRDLAGAKAYLCNGPIHSYQQNGFGPWRLSLAADDTFIGTCGLIRRESLPAVDLGYALLPAFYGQGFALEAARSCLAQANALGIDDVIAIVTEANLSSRRLLTRLGMQSAGKILFGEPAEELLLYKRLSL